MVATANNAIGITGVIGDGSVKVMVLKALGGSEGSGTTSSIIKAISYAEKNGATICNMSIGTNVYDRALRSEERRVGKECVSTCSLWGSR